MDHRPVGPGGSDEWSWSAEAIRRSGASGRRADEVTSRRTRRHHAPALPQPVPAVCEASSFAQGRCDLVVSVDSCLRHEREPDRRGSGPIDPIRTPCGPSSHRVPSRRRGRQPRQTPSVTWCRRAVRSSGATSPHTGPHPAARRSSARSPRPRSGEASALVRYGADGGLAERRLEVEGGSLGRVEVPGHGIGGGDRDARGPDDASDAGASCSVRQPSDT